MDNGYFNNVSTLKEDTLKNELNKCKSTDVDIDLITNIVENKIQLMESNLEKVFIDKFN